MLILKHGGNYKDNFKYHKYLQVLCLIHQKV